MDEKQPDIPMITAQWGDAKGEQIDIKITYGENMAVMHMDAMACHEWMKKTITAIEENYRANGHTIPGTTTP